MHVELLDLWVPIVLSAVGVFIAATVAHTVLPHHHGDWAKLPDEEGFLGAVRGKLAPGQYMFPHCDPSQRKDPQAMERMKAGPHGVMIVWGRSPEQMGGKLLATFIYYLVVGVFVAYVASVALQPGVEYLQVFQVTGTAAIMAHCFGGVPFAIWFGKSVRSTAFDIIDGIVYGLITAGFFGWLWPDAAAVPPLG